jgi:hypothetical protein
MTKIIGLLGFIGSGKGTVATHLVEKYHFRQDSFASSLKDACACLFDWPRHLLEGDTTESRSWREVPDAWWGNRLGIENFTPRLALQLMGTDVLRDHFHQDLWFNTVENRIRKNPTQSVVISDVRFPNEIDFIKKQGGTLIRIDRGDAPVWYETALLANRGNNIAKEIMSKTYTDAHYSEWAWVDSDIDYLINNTTLEKLYSQVTDIMNEIS